MSGAVEICCHERDEGEAHVPLTLLSSRLRHSQGSEKKENECWKLLMPGVPHLERDPSFQWTLLLVPTCQVGILFLLFYLSLSHSDFCFCIKFTLPF